MRCNFTRPCIKQFSHAALLLLVLSTSSLIAQQAQSALTQKWNYNTNTWTNLSRYIFEYDSNGYPTSLTREDPNNSTGAWDNRFKDVYANDDAGRPLVISNFYWNVSAEEWQLASRRTCLYDTSGRILLSQMDSYNSAPLMFIPFERETYMYDELGLVSRMTELYDSVHQQWTPLERALYTHTIAGTDDPLVFPAFESFDTILNSGFHENVASSSVTYESGETWDSALGAWIASGGYAYSYDADGRVTLVTGQSLIAAGDPVHEFNRLYKTYDASGRVTGRRS